MGLACLSVFMLFSMPVCAVDFVAEGGLHFGGDTMVTVTTEDGSPDVLKAGEEISLAAGLVFPLSDSIVAAVTFGLKKEVVYPAGGAITFSRYPLNALVLYQFNNWRLGGGLTYHLNPVYKVDTETQQEVVEFSNAPGLLVDVRYFVHEYIYIASRVTWIKYAVENDPTGRRYDGSSLGVLLGIQL